MDYNEFKSLRELDKANVARVLVYLSSEPCGHSSFTIDVEKTMIEMIKVLGQQQEQIAKMHSQILDLQKHARKTE